MRNLHNIDKSAFRKGEYVGYADGAWRIARCNSGWIARKNGASFTRATLHGISMALDCTAKFLAENPGAAAYLSKPAA